MENILTRTKLSDMKIKTTKKEQKLIPYLLVGSKNEVVCNPYSGEEVELTPEAVAIYDLVKGSEITNSELFDTGLDIFIRNWPNEYSILLD